MQLTKRIQCDYVSGVRSSEADRKTRVDHDPCVITAPLKTRGTDPESKQGAKGVEDGLPVMQSKAVKTLEKFGSQTVYEVTEKLGNSSGQVGKMKMADVPQKPCKQTMRNSSELANSRRHLGQY